MTEAELLYAIVKSGKYLVTIVPPQKGAGRRTGTGTGWTVEVAADGGKAKKLWRTMSPTLRGALEKQVAQFGMKVGG